MSNLHFRTRNTYSPKVGKQPVTETRMTGNVKPHEPVSERDLQGYEFREQEQEQLHDQEREREDIATNLSAGVSSTTFVTSSVGTESLDSYAPDDPRAAPALQYGWSTAHGGFLPPPPI